ncbi:bifunctional tetrahydrofolate synthase/dihydrofolate synthase [Marinobacter mobilis]|uniref:bifunctional tetrahydrofolate synthase/dihydrofolate synthase n=1 Tax=Marinobacter mobilis TaxID=488533 RepID=UPI0035C6B804
MPHNSDLARQQPVAPVAGASLNDWLSYLEAIHPVEIDLGLDRVLTVFRRLFRRPPKARVVTVAGTNGKGSAVTCLAGLLRQTGRSVGTYTSPHLHRYNERVMINGTPASDERLVCAFEAVEAARGSTSLTYFEFGTLAAFQVLAEAGVEDWVLEVGLGGRLDAVNVVDPELAIITSVDIDHVAFLSDDREVIGFEKAGILRQGKPAIYADIDPPSSVLQQVSAQRIPLLRLGVDYSLADQDGRTVLSLPSAKGLAGAELVIPEMTLPLNSVAAAVVAALMLEPGIGLDTVTAALRNITLPGRFERLASEPDVVVDVGHNPHAARWLARQVVLRCRSGGKIRAIYGALSDKDIEGVVREMKGAVDEWYLVGLDCPRGLSSEELGRRCAEPLSGAVQSSYPSVESAINQVRVDADTRDLVIVFGSFFTVADARLALGAENAS